MILTITLNPAVDKTYLTGCITLGQVNRMKKVVNIPGGKGINVTKILRKFGREVVATGYLGGYNGQFIEDSMREIGVRCEFVHVEQETRTSINIIADDGFVTELLEPGPMISVEQKDELLQKVRELLPECEVAVLSGSAAMGLPADIYAQIITLCNDYQVPSILDTSGQYLMEGIKALPYMIKPNLKELEYVAGGRLVGMEEVAAASTLLSQMGISKVVTTMGSRGMLYADEEVRYHAKPPHLEVVNTVGCGDCVVAAYAMNVGISQDAESIERILREATAIAASNAMTLENGDIDIDSLQEIEKKVTVREL